MDDGCDGVASRVDENRFLWTIWTTLEDVKGAAGMLAAPCEIDSGLSFEATLRNTGGSVVVEAPTVLVLAGYATLGGSAVSINRSG